MCSRPHYISFSWRFYPKCLPIVPRGHEQDATGSHSGLSVLLKDTWTRAVSGDRTTNPLIERRTADPHYHRRVLSRYQNQTSILNPSSWNVPCFSCERQERKEWTSNAAAVHSKEAYVTSELLFCYLHFYWCSSQPRGNLWCWEMNQIIECSPSNNHWRLSPKASQSPQTSMLKCSTFQQK